VTYNILCDSPPQSLVRDPEWQYAKHEAKPSAGSHEGSPGKAKKLGESHKYNKNTYKWYKKQEQTGALDHGCKKLLPHVSAK
jgi:hypothetical protein